MTQYFVPPAPLEDSALDAALQAMVVGVTGLPGDLVRPRWQPKVPKQPEPNVDWCSIGVSTDNPTGLPYIEHLSSTDITAPSGDLSEQHNELEVLVSFMGPNCKANLGILRSGLYIQQNRDAIKAQGLYLVSMDAGRAAPDFINQQWIRRWDSMIVFRRMVARTYAVANIVSAEIDISDDSGHVKAVVAIPPSGR